ncbi:MAG: carbamoyl-phosphate synthase (glutamine-hydrolyzing) large subunit [Myxococcales bacterium]|nr:carbamoyl-phosphate synthase (glutamine-hydrolyzing) large subunit [Myxococcales bacterium]
MSRGTLQAGRGLLPPLPRRVLVLGSGALQIGQAGEFDYSGTQALKALREEGIATVLINPNIATVQTQEGLADAVYYLPVEPDFVEGVIERERVDAILLGFGGQSALNCGLALADAGVLTKHGVRVLGPSIAAIRACEDRKLFADRLREIDVPVARGKTATSLADARSIADEIGLPLVLRAGFSLGGRGSAVVHSLTELDAAVERALAGNGQVLLEECLSGWKEIEYELVRDGDDNAITVCNMENIDPMGVHTGESIVVAPSQTLSDADYQLLRDAALRAVRHLGIIGECNIQFALDPRSSRYRAIEVNPRLSRSSALASKATGYPLAYVAAKLALGYTLPQLRNSITQKTPAMFEPALDYVVVKAPRWDLEKFRGADTRIGTEMKSVGEVMAIGRSLPEALQKALRMLEVGADGFDPSLFAIPDLDAAKAELSPPSSRRIFALARAFELGMSVAEAAALTAIDPFFLRELFAIAELRAMLSTRAKAGGLSALSDAELRTVKQSGFSDAALAKLLDCTADAVRARRHAIGLRPHLRQIDTLAAEYPAETNYLYFTYHAVEHDVVPRATRKLLLLGSGCYRIGSSVEFDTCCVGTAQAARALGFEVTLLNCNPETVSTDYDLCDRLVFDEVSIETVLELRDFERASGHDFVGTIVAMGGQTPNRLALPLSRAGVRLLGTPPESIDRAEDRAKFSALCDALSIDQPRWMEAGRIESIETAVQALGGFPVLVRPSYVLSGAAMRVAHSLPELLRYLQTATQVSPEHPVVVTKFERHAREIELDAVADRGRIVAWAISEHIEDAGVHSGDATLVLPPHDLTIETVRKVRRIAEQLARALQVSGPFNVQLLAKDGWVKVIECNLRASRSLPFVARALRTDFVQLAAQIMLNTDGGSAQLVRSPAAASDPLDLPYTVVKAPMFSFRRLSGADPLLGVEMASTGEVGCFGHSKEEALAKALLATGMRFPTRGVLLSLGPAADKYLFADEARLLSSLGLVVYATAVTAEVLSKEGIACIAIDKGESGPNSEVLSRLRSGDIDLVINLPRTFDAEGRPDGFRIRRAAIDLEIPLITDLALARAIVRMLTQVKRRELAVLPYSAYQPTRREPL